MAAWTQRWWKPSGSVRSHSDTGMRRVDWVRFVVGETGTTCQAVGAADRLPLERVITLATATGLLASGVPAVVRQERPC